MNFHKSPPAGSLLSDIKDLLALVSDPSKTSEAISGIQAEIFKLEELQKGSRGKQEELCDREKLLFTLEQNLTNKSSDLANKETKLKNWEDNLSGYKTALEKRDQSLAQKEIALQSEKDQFEQSSAARLKVIENRDTESKAISANLKSESTAFQEKINRLKAFVG